MPISATAQANASCSLSQYLGEWADRVLDQIQEFKNKNMTLMFWFKYTGQSIDKCYRIIGNRSTLYDIEPTPFGRYWSLEITGSGKLLLLVNDIAEHGVREIIPNEYYHIALIRTYEGTSARYQLVVNGCLERDTGMVANSNDTTTNDQPIRIGVGLGVYAPLVVDELFFYNRALTLTEINEKARLYEEFDTLKEDDNILRHYRFNEAGNTFKETIGLAADAIFMPTSASPLRTPGGPILRTITEDVERVAIQHETATLFRGMSEGQCRVIVNNHGNKYGYDKTWNEATVTNTEPGIKADLVNITGDIQVSADYAGDKYALFTGAIRSLDKSSELGHRVINLDCADGFFKARDRDYPSKVKEDVDPRDIFQEIFNAMGYPQPVGPSGGFNISSLSALPETPNIPFAWFEDTSIGSAIKQLLNYGHYFFYLSGEGFPTVKSRDEFINGNLTPVASLDEFNSFEVANNLDSVYNIIKVYGHPRKVTEENVTIAEIDQVIEIDPGESEEFFLTYEDDVTNETRVPVVEHVTPVASLDYQLHADEQGFTDILTDQASVSVTFFGTTALTKIHNGSSQTAYLTKYQLRGKPARALPTIYKKTVVGSSELYHGPRELKLESDFISDYSYARKYGEFLAREYHNEYRHINASVKNVFPLCLTNKFGDSIRVKNDHLNLDENLIIMGLDHDISMVSGLQHAMAFNLVRWESTQ